MTTSKRDTITAFAIFAALLVAGNVHAGGRVWSPANELSDDAHAVVQGLTCFESFSAAKQKEVKSIIDDLNDKHEHTARWELELNGAGYGVEQLLQETDSSVDLYCRWLTSDALSDYDVWLDGERKEAIQ